MAKKLFVNDLKGVRQKGFISGFTNDTMKYILIEKASETGSQNDWYVTTGPNPDPVWNEESKSFENPETFGLVPNISSSEPFKGAYLFSREMAEYYKSLSAQKLTVVSYNEAMGFKRR